MTTGNERRIGGRFRHEVDVDVHTADDSLPARALDVSRHGMFIAMQSPKLPPPPVGHAVLLTVKLVSGPFETMATVVRRVDEQGASPLGVGMGVELFCLGAEAKVRWDRFVLSLESPNVTLPTRAHSTVDADACFLVQPADPAELLEFYVQNVAGGRTLYVSPAVRRVGAAVLFVLVHPHTRQESMQRATVVEWSPDHPQRMGVRFTAPTRDAKRAFRKFLGPVKGAGRITTAEGAPLVTAERPKWTEYAFYSPKLAREPTVIAVRDPSGEGEILELLDVIEGELQTLPELDWTDKRALFDFNWNAEDDEKKGG